MTDETQFVAAPFGDHDIGDASGRTVHRQLDPFGARRPYLQGLRPIEDGLRPLEQITAVSAIRRGQTARRFQRPLRA